MDKRRVVITGAGAVTPVGNTAEEFWTSLLAGRSGIGPITRFDASQMPTRIAGEIKGFDALKYIDKKDDRKFDRFLKYAVACAVMAVEDAELKTDSIDATRFGVLVGSGIGGIETLLEQYAILTSKGPDRVSPFFVPMIIVNMAAGVISMRFGAKGPNEATATACTTSAHSIGDSLRIIQHGDADVMIAGGAEAAITPMGVGGFAAMRALSTRNDDPERASRPWDAARDGFVIGEGAGILILEELEFAKRRSAPILAELVGYGMSGDAYHITQPAPEHEGGFRVMKNALHDAKLQPNDIGYVNAHGTSTPIGDVLEAHAIRNFFGERTVPVSSTKSMTGHLLGGAGGLEAGVSVLALRDQILPPTINLENQDPDTKEMDFVPNQARKASLDYALSNSFGFGGTNGALVFRRWTS